MDKDFLNCISMMFLSEQNTKKSILFLLLRHFIVSKFNLQKGDLIRPGQVLFLLFLQISLFIYFNLGLRLATERNWPIHALC